MKSYTIKMFIFVIFTILLNYFGKLFAETLSLPFWFDSLGTVLAAYVLGPFCGAVVGVSCNVIYGVVYSPLNILYAFVSIFIAIIVGIASKRKYLETVFGIFSVSFFLAVSCVFVSVFLNYKFFNGNIGNVWGDGVATFLHNFGINKFLSHIVGQFYLEFLDKVITMFFLFASIKGFRYLKIKSIQKIKNKKMQERESLQKGLTTFVFAVLFFQLLNPSLLNADNNKIENKRFNSYVSTLYNDFNGLFGGIANDIVQTQDGVLWIGTYNGLYRYSGNTFRFMNNFSDVKNVNCLYTDEEGRLWIGTNDNGVSIAINENIENTITEIEGLSSDSVRCITQDSNGLYYVGTSAGLSLISISGGLSVVKNIPEINYSMSISSNKKGDVAVVTNNGDLYILKSGKIVNQLLADSKKEVSCCSFIDDQTLYIGTTKNEVRILKLFENEIVVDKIIDVNPLRAINSIEYFDGDFIFICSDNGIGYLDSDNNFFDFENNFNSSVTHVLKDYQENFWFTSSRLGLLKLCKSVFTAVYPTDSESVVNSVTKWNDNFYYAKDNGLGVFYNEDNLFTKNLIDLFENVRIRCLFVDSKNNLWIATAGKGFYKVSETGQIKKFDSSNGALGTRYRAIIEKSNGEIVVCGDTGLTFVKNDEVYSVIEKKHGLKNPKILCVVEVDSDTLFAGTDGGGICVIKNGKVQKELKKSDGLSSDVILKIQKSYNDEEYFVVTSNSICYLKDEKIEVLSNFPYSNNYDIIDNKNGTLYVLSSAGIFVVEKNQLLSGKPFDYDLLNSKKGLTKSLTVNAWNYIDENGLLYISADSCIVCLDINNQSGTTRSYRSMLKKVNVDNESFSVERGEPIIIPKETQRINFFPEVINYSLNDPYVMLWLEGFDNEPKYILQSELANVSYTNLAAGDYVFHVGVMDGKKSKIFSESLYRVHKEKEIYSNWWFVLYVVLVFALAMVYISWLFFRTKIQKIILAQKRELEFTKKQIEMGNETILTIAKAVDARDENTSQHSLRVSEYSVMIAKKLGFSEDSCEDLRKIALLHDIGKIGIPDSILKKPSSLTTEEYLLMKEHVIKGAEILKNFTHIENVSDGALYHHERFDGSGYANGLKGKEIPINARIIGLADAFDAMTANRVYRKKLDINIVIEELKKGKGSQFDPELVDILLNLIDSSEIDVSKIYNNIEKETK